MSEARDKEKKAALGRAIMLLRLNAERNRYAVARVVAEAGAAEPSWREKLLATAKADDAHAEALISLRDDLP